MCTVYAGVRAGARKIGSSKEVKERPYVCPDAKRMHAMLGVVSVLVC